ncbi:MAG: hypothetical protein RLT05_33600, partial [Bauldia litoralis]
PIYLYCATRQACDFWESKNEGGIFADVKAVDILYRTSAEPVADPEAVMARAASLEERLGTTINTFAVSDRHLGRGYALGGFRHPRSRRSENTSYVQMVAGFTAVTDFWLREFEEKKPTLVINCGKVAAVVARTLGVPYRTLAGSRFKNFHQWAHNEFFENYLVEDAFGRASSEADQTIEVPYYAHMTLRDKYMKNMSLPRLCLNSGKIGLRHAYWRLRGYEKAKGYYPMEEVRYVWRRRSDLSLLDRLCKPLSALSGKRFVYYPLHTEPETALQTLSPEYFYQLSCIAALSRDLPVGVTLAVKETFEATGRRPADFYRQIAELKNVVLLDMMELGLEVARQADAVATITGTGGFEAAVMGKPVISFGRHNQYNFLPHVSVIEDEADLRPALRTALSPEFDSAVAEEAGRKFLSAVLSVSFDLRDYDYVDLRKFQPETVADAVEALRASLAQMAQ